MNRAKKLLLTTTTGLAILFSGCTTRSAPSLSQEPEALTPPSVTTVIQGYNTAASDHLKQIAADFNKNQPKGASPIVYVDYDQVVTWAQLHGGDRAYEDAIGDYLKAKTGKTFDEKTIEKVFNAMNAQQPAALTPSQGVDGACVVVPEYPGASFDSYYTAGFRIGDKLLLDGKVVTLNLSSREFSDFAAAHESWHCFDVKYRNQSADGLAGAVKDNHAEMFADLGGVMEQIKKGADLSFIDKIAAERATWVYVTGAARTQLDDGDDGRYMSIVYNTHPGLYALKDRISDMGLDNFRKLDRDQMRELATEITDAHGLTFMQAAGLEAYYKTGKAPASMQGTVAQLKDAAEKSVRKATPQEMAARAAESKTATEGAKTVADALQKRAAELGNADNLANQLQARREMTDSLRASLSAKPSASTQATLDQLFLSGPQLPKKGG